jgi:hypothetical protein
MNAGCRYTSNINSCTSALVVLNITVRLSLTECRNVGADNERRKGKMEGRS